MEWRVAAETTICTFKVLLICGAGFLSNEVKKLAIDKSFVSRLWEQLKVTGCTGRSEPKMYTQKENKKREWLYHYFPHFALSLAESSVGWQLSLSASDIIIPGRIRGLNHRAACKTVHRQRSTTADRSTWNTWGQSLQPRSPSDAPIQEMPPEEATRRLPAALRQQIAGGGSDWWFLDGSYCQMLNSEKRRGRPLRDVCTLICHFCSVLNSVSLRRSLRSLSTRQESDEWLFTAVDRNQRRRNTDVSHFCGVFHLCVH